MTGILAITGWIIGVIGLCAALGAAVVMFRSGVNKATTELWKGEAEAQKARADRLEEAVADLTSRVEKVEHENETLRTAISAAAEIKALTHEVQALREDVAKALPTAPSL